MHRVTDSRSRSAAHMRQIAYAQGRAVSHIPVARLHDPLPVGGEKDFPVVRFIQQAAVYLFIFCVPPVRLVRAGDGERQDHIRTSFTQADRLKCGKGIKAKRAPAEKPSVSCLIGCLQASAQPRSDQGHVPGRQDPVTGKECGSANILL